MRSTNPISGKTIVVAEDDYLLAMSLNDDLADRGATVIGPLPTCAETMDFLRGGIPFDAAILDINLTDGQIYDVADLMIAQARPFVFASSMARQHIPPRFSAVPLLVKPLEMDMFVKSVFETQA